MCGYTQQMLTIQTLNWHLVISQESLWFYFKWKMLRSNCSLPGKTFVPFIMFHFQMGTKKILIHVSWLFGFQITCYLIFMHHIGGILHFSILLFKLKVVMKSSLSSVTELKAFHLHYFLCWAFSAVELPLWITKSDIKFLGGLCKWLLFFTLWGSTDDKPWKKKISAVFPSHRLWGTCLMAISTTASLFLWLLPGGGYLCTNSGFSCKYSQTPFALMNNMTLVNLFH